MSRKGALIAGCFLFSYSFSAHSTPLENAKITEIYAPMSLDSYAPSVRHIVDPLQTVSSIELDIWQTEKPYPIFTGAKVPGDWFVRHGETIQADGKKTVDFGNKNNCGGGNAPLSECLKDIKKWHQQMMESHGGHALVTIFVDIKQMWSGEAEQRTPADLDALIKKEIGEENIYLPAEFKGQAASLKEAALQNHWPTQGAVKNKFLFLLTGYGFVRFTKVASHMPTALKSQMSCMEKNCELEEYVAQRKDDALFFVCPDIKSVQDIESVVLGFDENTTNLAVVCFNINMKNFKGTEEALKIGQALRRAHYLSHIWGLNEETTEDFKYAVDILKGNYIGVEHFNNPIFTNMHGVLGQK